MRRTLINYLEYAKDMFKRFWSQAYNQGWIQKSTRKRAHVFFFTKKSIMKLFCKQPGPASVEQARETAEKSRLWGDTEISKLSIMHDASNIT